VSPTGPSCAATSRSTTTRCPDSPAHRGKDGWERWSSDWQAPFEGYGLERLEQVQLDDRRILTVHRLRARGRASGGLLQRTWAAPGAERRLAP
jgi:hypothetical protein